MRIDALRLIAYGPFDGTVLNMSGGEEGFHLIYGANEAGKSSALRALRHLLYGIPERSTDNFLHAYGNMRIAGSIRSRGGNVLDFIRRKGRGNTLRTADDSSVLEDSALQSFLGGVHEDLFNAMFGIDHEDLVRGGQEIIHGGGDVGRLIFSAGSGIANLREVQNELQAAADQLFRPAGQKQKINEALAHLNAGRKTLLSLQLPGREWIRHDESLRSALTRKAAVESELTRYQRELNRLERIRQAFPLIANRRELIKELEAYAPAVLLPEGFSEQRRELLTRLAVAKEEKKQAIETIASHQDSISSLNISTGFLNNAERIEEIHGELGSHRKAAKDRITLETRHNTLIGEAKEILRGLRDDLTLEQAERLHIKKSEIIRIQELGIQYERIVTRMKDARDKLPALTQEIAEIKEALDALGVTRSIQDLMAALAEAEEWGLFERQFHVEQAAIRSDMNTAENMKKKLGLEKNSFEEIESLPVPSSETIRVFDDRFDTIDSRLNDILGEHKRVGKAGKDVERQIEINRLEREVPTEEDLLRSREKRDLGWRLVAGKLNEQPVAEAEIENFIEKTPGSKTLSEAFESNLHATDEISDRLRREADRVATKARFLADQAAFKEQLQRIQKDLELAENEKTEIFRQWEILWQPVGVVSRSPKEMQRWVQDLGALAEKYQGIRDRKARAEASEREIEKHRQKLIQCLQAFKEAAGDETLNTLIHRGQVIVKSMEELIQKRALLERDKVLREKELAAERSRLENNQKALKLWQEQWETAVRPIGLEADAMPAQATAVMEELKSLFDTLKEADILRKRITGIDRDADDFTGKVTDLLERIAPELIGRSPDEAALELHGRLKGYRDARSRQETLDKQLKKEQERLDRAKNAVLKVETQLRRMCEEARCDTIDELADSERRSNRKRQIENDLKNIDERLRQLSAGAPVADFIEQAMEVDSDSISGEFKRLEETTQSLTAEKSDLDQTIGSERTELGRMDGSDRAAETAEEIQLLLGTIENDIEQYVRVKIAAGILSRAIERFRKKSQGPILNRASTLFSQITQGAFEGLRADFDDTGRPVIVGVRQAGGIVTVDGMSDGTADQVYLALRLAGLEMYLERYEPLPLIVDDILIRFDNDRAAATLKVLAELSKKTQVIFFTHHHHLVEIAEKSMDESILKKYDLVG